MATIQKRGDTYKITASCGYDMAGKQIRRHITWAPAHGMTHRQIEKELERQKVLFEEKCRTGQLMGGSIRFADFAERWLKEYAEKQLRHKTLAGYRIFLERINAAIGHIKLDRLQPHHLLAFYDNLAEAGVRGDVKYHFPGDFPALLRERALTRPHLAKLAGVCITTVDVLAQGKNVNRRSAEKLCAALGLELRELEAVGAAAGLSSKSIRHYHALISSIMSTAVQWQVVAANPCARVKPPKLEHTEPRYLDETEAAHLLELIESEDMQYKTMVKLLLYTGFRRGELCGLQWDDVDFENQVITVRRSTLYVPELGVFEDETKNKTSNRCIKAPAVAFDMLAEYRRWQAEQRLEVGDQWRAGEWLFTSWNGAPINPSVITGWFHRFVARSGLPDISIHSLRHTNATLLISGGVPLPTISKRLGHADSSTTSRIYIHAIKSADEAAAETLQNLLAPRGTGAKIG